MLKTLKATIVGALAALAFATTAHAALFQGSFSVNANNGDGLLINTEAAVSPAFQNGAANKFSFDLPSVGSSQSFDLFKIWTPETALNADDLGSRPITVSFSFTLPLPGFDGEVEGSTVAGTILIASWGSVDWDGYTDFSFGPNDDGILRVWLSDETFNGKFGTNFKPGKEHGATVTAKFKLIQDASEAEVPEPVSIALLGAGLAGLGIAARRRRAV